MKFIAHRGNLQGPNPEKENEPLHIFQALDNGFDVEVDIRYIEYNKSFYLGHDKPVYYVNESFIMNPNIWFHSKDIQTFYKLALMGVNTFIHDKDDMAYTTRGYFWTYPGRYLTPRSIAVLPEVYERDANRDLEFDTNIAYGICSDYILEYKESYEKN